MDSRSRQWGPRALLFAAGLLYLAIGSKFALQPAAAGAQSGLGFIAPVGATTVSAGLGGFPLGVAGALLFCAVAGRTAGGLQLAAAVTGAALVVRLFSALRDDTLAPSLHLLAPETAVVLLTSLGAILAARRAPS